MQQWQSRQLFVGVKLRRVIHAVARVLGVPRRAWKDAGPTGIGEEGLVVRGDGASDTSSFASQLALHDAASDLAFKPGGAAWGLCHESLIMRP